MSVYAYMVTKNEADRYLKQAIDSLLPHVDGLFVYDDRSTDATVDWLTEWKVPHVVRGRTEPSFQEDESLFRQNAWNRMTSILEPSQGDWIFTLDADERLRTSHKLRDISQNAEGHDALWMRVHEMWAPGQIRTDGFWGVINALRFCQFKPNGTFLRKKMGGGSVPDFVANASTTDFADILHFGYFNETERAGKMERYLANPTHGHNPKHIRSIILPPTLAPLPDLV